MQPSVTTSILEALGDEDIGKEKDLEIRSALSAAFGGASLYHSSTARTLSELPSHRGNNTCLLDR